MNWTRRRGDPNERDSDSRDATVGGTSWVDATPLSLAGRHNCHYIRGRQEVGDTNFRPEWPIFSGLCRPDNDGYRPNRDLDDVAGPLSSGIRCYHLHRTAVRPPN